MRPAMLREPLGVTVPSFTLHVYKRNDSVSDTSLELISNHVVLLNVAGDLLDIGWADVFHLYCCMDNSVPHHACI